MHSALVTVGPFICFTLSCTPRSCSIYISHPACFLFSTTQLDLDTYAGARRDHGYGHGQYYQCIYVVDSNLAPQHVSIPLIPRVSLPVYLSNSRLGEKSDVSVSK